MTDGGITKILAETSKALEEAGGKITKAISTRLHDLGQATRKAADHFEKAEGDIADRVPVYTIDKDGKVRRVSSELRPGSHPALDAGRTPTGRALLRWAADPDGPRLCLVTGGAGIGKSHLIARFAAGDSGQSTDRVNALLPADDLGPTATVWQLARQLGHGGGSVADVLLRAARGRTGGRC